MIAAEEVEAVSRRMRVAVHAVLDDAPRLERWQVDRSLGRPCLVGFVYDHPGIEDGRLVRTSDLRRVSRTAGWALTRNRFYRLGVSIEDWRSSLQ